jgi:hypothetical protein
MVDATGYKSAHFLIREDQIVGALDAHAEFLARSLHKLKEFRIG